MTRAPAIRAAFDGELVVDNFAGGGGASTGIAFAIGRDPDIAINHDAEAIAMHRANHPTTRHYQEDVWQVDPVEACAGRPVGLAWFSPACTHFSRAKGTSSARNAKIRGLAWVVIRWARAVRPRVICLENVEEFETWGPLDANGHPDKRKAGLTFRFWVGKLRALGYAVEFRSLTAADYGTPTTRRRLFMIARCDGQAIQWPEPTHGKGRAEKWRPASDVIDWSLPCPSIFERRKPLADATLRRVAVGIQRFVIGSADPFLLKYNRTGGALAVGGPLPTITTRDRFALVEPFLVRHGHYSTITGAGLREGCGAGTFRGQQLSIPLATVCATNDKHLVAPIIAKHYGGVVGHRVDRTLGTVTAKDHHALVAAFLTKFYGTSIGSPMQLPLPTVTANGKGGGHLALVMVHGEPYRIVDIGMRMLQPHELFSAQGFPADYEIAPEHNGRPLTKTAQTRLAGNSVCPQVAKAIVEAQAAPAAQELSA